MTSFMINEHVGRNVHEDWRYDSGCTFCRIIGKELPSAVLYETDEILAILDILPLRPGHTLVIPKVHIPHVTDLPENIAAAMGVAVSKVGKAVSEAMQNTALNIVCNQEYAQSVPHVHFHIIPAPQFEGSPRIDATQVVPRTRRELHQLEYEERSELDKDEGRDLAEKIRARL
ncbi:HIT-like protein [Pisolithus croceorrhizus]|nr:HIT-like protein [Pisolithus croceorrhizus]KAI6099456.1 HIT-like protein [Pisolithus croceorrhizus]